MSSSKLQTLWVVAYENGSPVLVNETYREGPSQYRRDTVPSAAFDFRQRIDRSEVGGNKRFQTTPADALRVVFESACSHYVGKLAEMLNSQKRLHELIAVAAGVKEEPCLAQAFEAALRELTAETEEGSCSEDC